MAKSRLKEEIEVELNEETIERLGDEAQAWMHEHYPHADSVASNLVSLPYPKSLTSTLNGWLQGFPVGWICAYERYEVERLKSERAELLARLEFVLARTPTDDGLYTFPDGDSWPASQALR
jgi:hypothetical protein